MGLSCSSLCHTKKNSQIAQMATTMLAVFNDTTMVDEDDGPAAGRISHTTQHRV